MKALVIGSLTALFLAALAHVASAETVCCGGPSFCDWCGESTAWLCAYCH